MLVFDRWSVGAETERASEERRALEFGKILTWAQDWTVPKVRVFDSCAHLERKKVQVLDSRSSAFRLKVSDFDSMDLSNSYRCRDLIGESAGKGSGPILHMIPDQRWNTERSVQKIGMAYRIRDVYGKFFSKGEGF